MEISLGFSRFGRWKDLFFSEGSNFFLKVCIGGVWLFKKSCICCNCLYLFCVEFIIPMVLAFKTTCL